MNRKTYFYLGFSHFMGIGPYKLGLLLKYFGDVESAYNASESKVTKLLGRVLADKFIQFRHDFNLEDKVKELRQKRILVLTREDKRFPEQLRQISDPPICLYVKGDITTVDFGESRFISVVGTRKPTSYGKQITRKLVAGLAQAGFVIVSGMAMGIDTVAHQTALDWQTKTVVILGCGVDVIYPSINKKLYDKIIGGGGLIISEFPPGMMSLPGLFISRNRLISGLSSGVLVVEGAKDSGALVTAKHAAEQGRDVFATPAPITSTMSEAPNILLKNGAKLVTSVEDILQEMNLRILSHEQQEMMVDLDTGEKKIVELLQREPYISDELAAETKLSINLVLRKLSQLELKGLVEKNNEGKYQLR